jgi:hypothetical protein
MENENQSLNKTTDNVIEPLKDLSKTQDKVPSTKQNTSDKNSDPKQELSTSN